MHIIDRSGSLRPNHGFKDYVENLELPPTVFTSGDTKVGVCSKHEFAHERFQSFSGYRSIGALVIEVVKVD